MNILIISSVIALLAEIFGGFEGHKKPYMRKYRSKRRVAEKNTENYVGAMPWILKLFLQGYMFVGRSLQ